jgi:hypothetical protein
MADFAERNIAVKGKQVIVRTNLNDGSYTVRDSFNRTVATGSAANGGVPSFGQGDKAAQAYILGINSQQAARRSGSLSINLSDQIGSVVAKRNIDNINYLASTEQKNKLRSTNYGNKVNVKGDTTPVAPNNGNGGGGAAGGNSGTDTGSTSTSQNNPQDSAQPQTQNASPEAPKQPGGTSSGDYRYPIGAIGTQDYVVFTRIEYVAGGGAANLSSGVVARPSERMAKPNILGTTILPIPTNVSSDNTVGWGDDKLDFVAAMKGGLAEGAIAGGRTLDDSLSNISATVGSNKESLKKLLTSSVAGQIAGSNLFTRTTGAITNSNLELLFTGPELRSFNFTYRLTPREAKESDQIKRIIRQFKQGMSPIIEQGQLFVKTPNVFRIDFRYNGDNPHPYLDRVKPCALTNFRVNYTPDNAYMTYPDGSPIAYEIAMTFKELEPVYSQDYDTGEGSTGMGF